MKPGIPIAGASDGNQMFQNSCEWPCDRLATYPGWTPPLAPYSWDRPLPPKTRYAGIENGWMEIFVGFALPEDPRKPVSERKAQEREIKGSGGQAR